MGSKRNDELAFAPPVYAAPRLMPDGKPIVRLTCMRCNAKLNQINSGTLCFQCWKINRAKYIADNLHIVEGANVLANGETDSD